jgi:hypothetical protein
MAINREDRMRAQLNQEAARAANRRAFGLPIPDEPAPKAPPRFINLAAGAINPAPPVHERPWNVHPQEVVRNIEADHWWDMQRAMMVDIEAVPAPPPINREGRIRRAAPRADLVEAMQGGWIPNPFVPRVIRVAEEDNMQGKVYGEDYS